MIGKIAIIGLLATAFFVATSGLSDEEINSIHDVIEASIIKEEAVYCFASETVGFKVVKPLRQVKCTSSHPHKYPACALTHEFNSGTIYQGCTQKHKSNDECNNTACDMNYRVEHRNVKNSPRFRGVCCCRTENCNDAKLHTTDEVKLIEALGVKVDDEYKN